MANITRSAKLASNWTENELDAYNIKIKFQNATTFFNTPALPEPNVDEELLTTVYAEDMVTEDNYRLLTQLELARGPAEAEESVVADFVVTLFQVLGYIQQHPHAIHTRKEIQHLICGEYKNTILDVCIIDTSEDEIILLVQEDKFFECTPNPFPPLIAEAIAAFQSSNEHRVVSGLPPLEDKIIPAIIMDGTSPIFLQVPITTKLVQCVELGIYPATPTLVLGHVPDIPLPHFGMQPLDNRHVILQCYEAFKKLVV